MPVWKMTMETSLVWLLGSLLTKEARLITEEGTIRTLNNTILKVIALSLDIWSALFPSLCHHVRWPHPNEIGCKTPPLSSNYHRYLIVHQDRCHLAPMSKSQLGGEVPLSVEHRPHHRLALGLHWDQLEGSQALEREVFWREVFLSSTTK